METADAFAALYRELVLDHGRAPRHAGALAQPTHRARASNPLCGDRIALDLRLDAQGRIAELAHDTEGCLICIASASLMAGAVLEREPQAALARLSDLRTGLASGDGAGLDELAALTGVSAHPGRHRCALLPWEALQAALAGGSAQ